MDEDGEGRLTFMVLDLALVPCAHLLSESQQRRLSPLVLFLPVSLLTDQFGHHGHHDHLLKG